jgi:hypothetical protein
MLGRHLRIGSDRVLPYPYHFTIENHLTIRICAICVLEKTIFKQISNQYHAMAMS